jgi:ring-1,2-phenylacetyl-CoA epoxidase subunit PaaC
MNHLINYITHLADNSLILSHRNSEWCGHGPVLEQDIALSNIALDLLGQARNFYQYAATKMNVMDGQAKAITEDDLAYMRTEKAFNNLLLTEQTNGDWGKTVMRQFLFSAFQFYYFEQLKNSTDKTLAAIAEKSLKETTYHLRWSADWVIRLGDGTDESKQRMEDALEELWMFTGEMFVPADFEKEMRATNIAVDVTALRSSWLAKVKTVFEEASLQMPDENAWMQTGGKQGNHTEHLGFLLAEMQSLQRMHPNLEW